MTTTHANQAHARYARAIVISKRVRWNIDADVLRARSFERSEKLLPDSLSLAHELTFLGEPARVFLSQVQGRTYANVFGLVERFINAKVLELGQHHWLDDQTALEALVRFSDEELKHQELFRRVDALAARLMPSGYSFDADPNAVARAVLSKSTWSVLALTCLIELFTQVHYKASIDPDPLLSPLFKDVFRFHWLEESQHAVLDELEWLAEDARISASDRDRAVSDLVELVAAVDAILCAQAEADALYFITHAGQAFSAAQREAIRATCLRAYRYQYILSGVASTRFAEILRGLVTTGQFERVEHALRELSP
ncbi:MAG TPA: hypothetical protein VJU61_21450 [Polyangiaceae bacterium]|nr:hypothetical protein [Polyangiaceae bacterium]